MNAVANVIQFDTARLRFNAHPIVRTDEEKIREGVKKRLDEAGKSNRYEWASEFAVSAYRIGYTVNGAIAAAMRNINCVVTRQEPKERA